MIPFHFRAISVIPLVIFVAVSLAVSAATPARSCIGDADDCKTIGTALRDLVKGPKEVMLGSIGTVRLPAGYGFIPPDSGVEFLYALGMSASSRFVGVIVPDKAKGAWIMKLEFDGRGHVTDADASTWKSDVLLAAILKDNQNQAAGNLRV